MNIPQAFAALALRIDTLWQKVVDIETATGKALQKLWDLQSTATTAITTLQTNVATIAASLSGLIGRVTTVEANAVLLTDRVGVLESALGGLTDGQTLKGSPMLTATQITDWFTANAILPDVDGRFTMENVLAATLALSGLSPAPGTFLLNLTSGTLPIVGFTDTMGNNVLMGLGDQLAFTVDENGTILATAANDQPSDGGTVTISPDPTADPLAVLNAQLSADFLAALV
jgi:hypothetical protein